MLTSLFKKQHERNARLPDGELERRRREEQRVRERDRIQAEYRAHQEEDLKHKHLHGGELAQLGAIWFPAGLFEKNLLIKKTAAILLLVFLQLRL
jgi:hypothetical protein